MVRELIPFGYPQVGTMEVHENHGHHVTMEFTYPNGYGASVIRREKGGFAGSYGGERGLFELAVLVGGDIVDIPEAVGVDNGDHVLGWLSADDVHDLLVKITELPVRG